MPVAAHPSVRDAQAERSARRVLHHEAQAARVDGLALAPERLRVVGGEGPDDLGEPDLDGGAQDGDVEVVLVREVVVHRAFADAGAGDDLVVGGAVEAPLPELLGCGGQDGVFAGFFELFESG